MDRIYKVNFINLTISLYLHIMKIIMTAIFWHNCLGIFFIYLILI